MQITDYRAALIDKVYQAQIKCPKCGGWILTSNLEVFKDDAGKLCAEATDVICAHTDATKGPCGHELGTAEIVGWPYSAPVKWRLTDAQKDAVLAAADE